MSEQIKATALALRALRARRGSRLSPSPSCVLEGRYHTALVAALQAIAAYHNFTLQEPIEVLKSGELSIVALSTRCIPAGTAYEEFGSAFAAALTAHHARGAGSNAGVISTTGYWCYLHYTHAEDLVNEYYDRLVAPLEISSEATEQPRQAPINDAKLVELIAFLEAHVTSSGMVAADPLSAHLYSEAAAALKLLRPVRVAAQALNPVPVQALCGELNREFAAGWPQCATTLEARARNGYAPS